jgi:hypothetical protein
MVLQGRGRGIGARQLQLGKDAALFLDGAEIALGVNLFARSEPSLEVPNQRADAQGKLYKLALMRRQSILATKRGNDLSTPGHTLAPRT